MENNYSYLARAWKSYTEALINHGSGSPEAESMFWAFDKIVDITEEKPLDVLEVIKEVLKITDDERILVSLAAGPLEDILVKHGREVIDEVILLVKTDPNFKDLLLGVWGNSVDKGVWKQLEDLFEIEP